MDIPVNADWYNDLDGPATEMVNWLVGQINAEISNIPTGGAAMATDNFNSMILAIMAGTQSVPVEDLDTYFDAIRAAAEAAVPSTGG